ncbi:MAG: 1-deoxy-D-xylulose-5-phosphate synthase [Actinomycetaceae bacterium]|nr:1-deoxy-D-xylulose-5-phosphate synthase [Actinomycetaceae bacterium]MDY6083283.1 1-deoxy-D-xylulose-5-phosphate synthase [Actinomycetaceae bacterium]
MSILDTINSPEDLKKVPAAQIPKLAAEIRHFLIENVAKTGGHLGPNLGVVELTIGIHRVFNSPQDSIIFDTGHQIYVHKLLTGRHDFSKLRQADGLSGYGNRSESVHDIVENSHASTSLSWADGIARANELLGYTDRTVVALIGDGAMTGGMAWEALNNIAEHPDRPLVIVLNDNGRSYAPTIGGMVRRLEPARKLDQIRVSKPYEEFLAKTKATLEEHGLPGRMAFGALRSIKRGLKEVFVDAGIFDSLRIKYLGPVNGHDEAEVEEALRLARDYGGTVVVHAMTQKGHGYRFAEEDEADAFHAIGTIHPETGLPVVESRFGYTQVFATEIAQIARENPRVVGVTAAMLRPVGFGLMQKEFPDRVIDVGIAEQHALTSAAGMAFAGLHPVIALYSTFLNRGYDQLLMDIALHHEPVTIVLDRSGITGSDGPSHNGMWDLSLATMIPGLRVAIPRDEATERAELREAVADETGPTLLRYPKGSIPEALDAEAHIGKADVVLGASALTQKTNDARVAVVAYGPMVHTAVQAVRQGLSEGAFSSSQVMVIDPRWALPVDQELVDELVHFDGLVTVEDGLLPGGLGTEVTRQLLERGVLIPTRSLGIEREFLTTDTRESLLARYHMTAGDVLDAIKSILQAE